MSRKYFGTDGVRGKVGAFPITPAFALQLGHAAGRVLVAQDTSSPGERPAVLIGKDTRVSGYLLEAALEAGFAAAGVDVCLVGPLPTPGVAYLTRALRLQAGVVISASHNPYDDNGIKFFSALGTKLPDEVEQAIEAEMDVPMGCVESARLGRARRIDDARGRYIEFCKSTFPNELNLRGLKLVVDCAHGAAYHVAPEVFHELGAEVHAIGAEPNGLNINAGCGATAPGALRQAVLEQGADLGIALDGDGDRLVMVDASGRIHDGDSLLYAIVAGRLAQGQKVAGVVGTLMSNLAWNMAWRPWACLFCVRRWATAMCWRCCWKRAGCSVARTPVTSFASTSTVPGMASSPPCRCWRRCVSRINLLRNCWGPCPCIPRC